jgi:hypothetical protein
MGGDSREQSRGGNDSQSLPRGACCAVSENRFAERFGREVLFCFGDLAFEVAFDGGGAALRAIARRTYPVMAAQRRMLKAIAAIVTWAAALACPT